MHQNVNEMLYFEETTQLPCEMASQSFQASSLTSVFAKTTDDANFKNESTCLQQSWRLDEGWRNDWPQSVVLDILLDRNALRNEKTWTSVVINFNLFISSELKFDCISTSHLAMHDQNSIEH